MADFRTLFGKKKSMHQLQFAEFPTHNETMTMARPADREISLEKPVEQQIGDSTRASRRREPPA
jgi:hypothetical protein